MNIFKDKKVIVLSAILILFTVVYFVLVNKVSYAFSTDDNTSFYYEKKLEVIEEAALKYAQDNKELFKSEDIIYIKIQDLIDNNLLNADESGKIINPLNEKDTLNDNVIKIKKEKDTFNVEIDS